MIVNSITAATTATPTGGSGHGALSLLRSTAGPRLIALPLTLLSRLLVLVIFLASTSTANAQWFWQNPLPQPNTLNDVSFVDAQTGMAVGEQGAVLRTHDGGSSWISQEAGWSDMCGGGVDAVFMLDVDTVWVATRSLCNQPDTFFDASISQTTDGGLTWTTQFEAENMVVSDVFFTDENHGTAVGFEIDFSQGAFVPAVLRTADGGSTWISQTPGAGIGVGLLFGVHFTDADTGFAVGNGAVDGGELGGLVLGTSDGGETWAVQFHDTGVGWINDVAFIGANSGIAVADDGVVLTTTDSGETWSQQGTGTNRSLKAVSCIDAMDCIAVGGGVGSEEGVTSGRIVLRTIDGGISWTTELLDENASTLKGVAFGDASTVVSVGWWSEDSHAGAILRSTDGGETWRSRTRSVTTAHLNAVAVIDEFTGIVVGEEGTILRTLDGGNTWVRETSGTTLPLRAVSLVDTTTGIAVGDKTILRTTNGGTSWTAADLAFTSLYDVACTDIAHCTAVGSTNFGVIRRLILRTNDGGDTWVTQLSELDESDGGSAPALRSVSCTDSNHCIAVGRNSFSGISSLVLRTTDGGESWSRTVIGESTSLRSVFFLDADSGVAVGERVGVGPAILRTTDGGETWSPQTLPPTVSSLATLTDVAFTDELTGTVVGSFSTLLRTTDGGETWLHELGEPTRGPAGGFLGVSFVDADIGTVVGASGQILRTVGGPTFPLGLNPSRAAVCVPDGGPEAVLVLASVGSVAGYSGTVNLSTSGEPPGVTSDLDPGSVEVPGSSTWTLSLDTTVSGGRHVVTLTADDGVDQKLADFLLDVIDPSQAPVPIEPMHGAIDVGLQPTFAWGALVDVGEYRLQVATDGEFGSIVIDLEIAGTGFTPAEALNPDTEYFWRVRGIHECGGAWSEVFSFSTEVQPLAEVTPEAIGFEVPAGGSDSATLSIANVGTGELVWSIETAEPPSAAGHAVADSGPGDIELPARNYEVGGRSVMLGLASLLGEPLPSVRPTNPAVGVTDCEAEPSIIIHDDGTVEDAYSGEPSVETLVIFADRFMPSSYPASFRAVCVAFVTLGPTSLEFEIVVFDDDGPDGSPGTELGALAAIAEDLPDTPGPGGEPMWFSYDISSLGITVGSGSVFIGVRWAPSDPNVFIAADTSAGNPAGFAGGYAWSDQINTWVPIVSAFPNYRSLFVRAVENPGGCYDPSEIPWLNVTPDAGSIPAGGSTALEVTVDAAGLDVGEYSASLCVSSNDPVNPLVAVPLSLTVTGGGAPVLAFDPASLDFGEVEVGTTGPPQSALLQNTGDVNASGLTFSLPGGGFEADTSACGDTLSVGASCEVVVTFTPTEPGPAATALNASSAEGASTELPLAGTGLGDGGFTPVDLEVDPEPFLADGNSVFEPGETVEVAPAWRNDGPDMEPLTGTASDFNGADGAIYVLFLDDADYANVAPGATASCLDTGVCYFLAVNDPAVRPATHWEASFEETLSDDTVKTWTLHIGASFADVPRLSPFYLSIETLLHHGVTGGCTATEYCPAGVNTRGQMAVFLLKAAEGGGYLPPPCVEGEELFADVPFDSALCPWIEELAARQVTSGCGSGNYCPGSPVTRGQMAVFLLKASEGEGYTPPACEGTFSDVPCPSTFADWIEELAERDVTVGCSTDPPAYCAASSVTRAQMAVFVTKTFGLTLYGP